MKEQGEMIMKQENTICKAKQRKAKQSNDIKKVKTLQNRNCVHTQVFIAVILNRLAAVH